MYLYIRKKLIDNHVDVVGIVGLERWYKCHIFKKKELFKNLSTGVNI